MTSLGKSFLLSGFLLVNKNKNYYHFIRDVGFLDLLISQIFSTFNM